MVAAVDSNDHTRERVAGFAAREVAPWAERFSAGGEFPHEVWRKMGNEGLLGLNLPESMGGLGCDGVPTLAALEAFVRCGHCLGLAFSWLIHLITSRHFVMEHGSGSQCARYLPQLAAGKITASVAISEPGVGAHPKSLNTTALNDGNGQFVLNGEKSFLTNGPVADIFIVFAVTSTSPHTGRKGFSAFIVERGTPGLSLTQPFDLGCFYPSPHCAMTLKDCRVPASSILGEKDAAYDRMAKPFRGLEDIYMTALALGGMELQLDLLLGHLRREGMIHGDDVKEGLGRLQVLLDSFRVVVRQIGAPAEDAGRDNPDGASLVLAFRHLSRHYQWCFERLKSGLGEAGTPLLGLVTRDLVRMGGIARSIAAIQQRKIGASLLSGKESNAALQP